MSEDKKTKRNRKNHLGDLRSDQDGSFIKSIGHGAADWRQADGRETGEECHQPKHERPAGQIAHHPTLGHHLHPCAGIGNRRPDDVTPKRTRAEKAERLDECFLFRAHRPD